MKPLTPLLVLLPLTLASSPSPGCTLPLPSTLTPGSSTYNITLSSASVRGTTTQRQYIVHLPSSYSAANNAPAPLVLAFHGQSLPARSMERISGFSDPAFNEGSVVVFPEGVAGEEFGVCYFSLFYDMT
jgi:poly(3-hydroxybutyrate) depolymerase